MHIMLGRDIRWYNWIVCMHEVSCWIIIISWCIIMHIMLGRDIRWYNWIIEVQEMSERVIIISWCIVVHTLCKGVVLS